MAEAGEGFLSHLKELQWRIRLALAVFVAGVMVLMNWSAPVFNFMAAPLLSALPAGTPMIFLNAPDVFFTYLKIALLGSLFVTSPLTFYQFWAFVAPGLYKHEKRLFLFAVVASVILFSGGGAFAYYIVFPLIFQFFLGFATDQIHALPAVKEYLSLFLKLVFAFGLCFQIPIVMMVLARLNIATAEGMARQRRYIIVWAFVVAAILTPPDVISQVLLAIPMLLLYELGLMIARISVPTADTGKEAAS
ncbi:twin-arginine translocase subunit TatC [Mariprofundus erugo]|uniref:Sec-independent protein translocase protein TatC n=1 Tax=Mariprofundus erugo TaxID=2528639 RepID=A0A5R9GWY1_9PROT|nr:twin-arginine translocase subunit TatC [Mariprofundus erugo]TLS67594.1 twin-arginine translocase subunit TatC [Mariprofundus erugo]